MRQQLLGFIIRWLLNSLGLWLAVKLFGTGYTETPQGLMVFLVAGLIFSVVNAMLRPIILILSLPALLLTLGLFMLVVNGFMVYVSLKLAPGVSMTFIHSILTGVVMSLVNYIVSNVIDFDERTITKGNKE
ncbi:MAG TPA: phage holin family protein [Patescibacteria group bacterium]|jgi:putative membrane protein|nr:phage holin family protein [Patescibacteria group bacterium]